VGDPIAGLAAHAAVVGAGRLPNGALPVLANTVAPVLLACSAQGRAIIRANLHVAFPDWTPATVEATVRAAARHMVLCALEFLSLASGPQRLVGRVDMSAPQAARLVAVGASGKPSILVTPHLGNWELMGQAAVAAGIRLRAVAHRIANPRLEALVLRARQRQGMEIIWERGAVREMARALRGGRPVGVLMDQNTRPGAGGVFADFFGLPATVTRAPAALARRFDAHVLVVACVRRGARFEVLVEDLGEAARDDFSEAELTRRMLAANESLIRRYPSQYIWLYKRWRYIPEAAPADLRRRYPFYAKPAEPLRTPRTPEAGKSPPSPIAVVPAIPRTPSPCA
jgi:KDO2-lipid IV(A) lauroyltransferase